CGTAPRPRSVRDLGRMDRIGVGLLWWTPARDPEAPSAGRAVQRCVLGVRWLPGPTRPAAAAGLQAVGGCGAPADAPPRPVETGTRTGPSAAGPVLDVRLGKTRPSSDAGGSAPPYVHLST